MEDRYGRTQVWYMAYATTAIVGIVPEKDVAWADVIGSKIFEDRFNQC